MNLKKRKISNKRGFRAVLTFVAGVFMAVGLVALQPQTASATECSDVYTPLSDHVVNGADENKSAYIQVMNETGVPWEMLAAIHYRETNFSRTNPSNGQGIFQFVNGDGGPYPPGPVSEEEFIRQLRFMANKLQDDYVWRGSVPRERRKLMPNETDIVLIKDTLYSYNGRAGVYAQQAAQYGYNQTTQPYEGSPYVMNRFDCMRARMGMITQDFGSMDGIDTRYGTFTVFARLRGDAYWQSLWSAYDWAIDSFTYSGGDNLVVKGQTETLTLKARNTGRLPWYNHGEHPVRLGTWSPADRVSPLAHSSWMWSARPTTLLENSVQPGEVGTFTFTIAPNTTGVFIEALNLVVENHAWIRWPGFSPTIEVTDSYHWKIQNIIYGNGTGVMEPGSTQLITIVARNTGNLTWNKSGGAPVRLGTWEPERKSALVHNWLSPIRTTDMNEASVPPGSTAGFQFWVKAPSTPGLYYERFNLVAEGQTWFNDPGLTLYIKSGDYAWQPVWSSISTGTTTIDRDKTFTITIRAKNTGDLTWRKNAGPPIRLGTAVPLNRGSHLYNPTWLSDIRPTGLIEGSVAPGQEGTFSFTAKAPPYPGVIVESFNLVAEGQKWFSSPPITFTLTIR